MTVTLQIKRKEFDLIKAGTKKTEWRSPSSFNKKRLFCDNGAGKLDGNTDIKSIIFVNSMRKDAQRLEIEVKRIRMVKFSRDVKIPEDNFEALKDMWAIEISLGSIIVNK